MDLFYDPKKVDEYAETGFEDLLENDMFTPSQSNACSPILDLGLECNMDNDWLDTFFDDPILNDRMISDANQAQPQVQTEHSYSLANNDRGLDMTIKTEESDMETEALKTTVNPNSMTPTNNCHIDVCTPDSQSGISYIKTEMIKTENLLKQEALDPETTMVTVTRTTNPQTLLKPTIILATQQQPSFQQHSAAANIRQERIVLPNMSISIKTEPASYNISSASALSPDMSYDQLSLPPTPPSSSSSDSDSCHSPDRSLPSSPVRHAIYQTRTSYRATPSPPPSAYSLSSQPFFMHPIPSTGVLLLSEEEKRTLVTEGYPIPGKLPLTKTEEKNLKKIRRKIKNKISAQESRRKKKEYLESLERKVESFCQDNVDLKKKVDGLETSNRSLMSQLHKLQSLVSKVRPHNATVSSAGSCLMVLVLCFAVFLGSWSPMSMTMGYAGNMTTAQQALSSATGAAPYNRAALDAAAMAQQQLGVGAAPWGPGGGSGGDGGEKAEAHMTSFVDNDPYTTPTLKSRVLMSLAEEDEEAASAAAAAAGPCLEGMLMRWYSMLPAMTSGWRQSKAAALLEQTLHTRDGGDGAAVVDRLDVESENNQTGESGARPAATTLALQVAAAVDRAEQQALMHPDMAVMTAARKQLNATQ